ncbi:MAG TPA: transcriptional regulator, partial [Bacillota bacterium]|nr:transcriptional regulator [Bacillota bacterium]
TLEDKYGLMIDEADDEVCLKVNARANKDAVELHKMLCAWRQVADMLKAGEITQEEYDRWRYRYPESDTSGQWHKVTPSQGRSDMLVDALNGSDSK